MTTYVVLNQKGGVGKTTLAANLAAVFASAIAPVGDDDTDSPVLLASIDPQGSAVWWAERAAELPFRFSAVNQEGILPRVPSLPGVEHVFIDTPGWIGDTQDYASEGLAGRLLDEALSIADMAIVPITPEALSFDPTARTIRDLLEPRGIPFKVVVNQWDPRDGDRDLNQTRDFVNRSGWPLSHAVIRRYKVHSHAAAKGQVVTDYPDNKVSVRAVRDFEQLALALKVGA
ncbi:ParA family protein [Gordonia alkaliphila]|uniref:ParA family protein n=1 Tax=Gordonia alkaliphila TaxID=1053547 RepID=UPI001FF2EAFD|nr:ParA family protein [Gordonia alkaliphila]MCK0441154.1 ParA family protein [Gordonia alkaliphila]